MAVIVPLVVGVLTYMAALFSTLAGFGASSLMIPLVQFFLPLHQTLILIALVHLFNSFWKLLFFMHEIRWKIALPFACAGFFGAYFGASLAISLPVETLGRVIGISIIVYAFFMDSAVKIWLPRSPWLISLAGLIGGFSSGALGIGGVIRSSFLIGLNISVAAYLSTLGAAGIVLDIARLLVYWKMVNGVMYSVFWSALVALPASLIGAWSAQRILENTTFDDYRFYVRVAIVTMGVKLLLFPS